MNDALLEKAGLLMNQQIYDEAEKILKEVLSLSPDNDYVFYLLSEIYLQKNDYIKAEELINNAITLYPEQSHYFFLKARLYYLKNNTKKAEEFITEAIRLYPNEADYYAFWAQLKLSEKKFQESLDIANQALATNPANLHALNIRSTALLKLNRKDESFNTIAEALNEDPNNSYTHSNYAWGLLEKGDVKASLQHFSEALKNDPNSRHAQDGMIEALKSRFTIYRWFMQYSFWMGNMTAKYQWAFILGFYFGSKGLQNLAAANESLQPFLYPLIFLLFVFAFSTWIISPLGNLFLRFNYYGKHLLSKEEKTGATLIGISLFIAILSGITYLFTGYFSWIVLAFFTFTMMIPLSRLYNKPRAFFFSYTLAMALVGIVCVAQIFTTGTINELANIYLFGLIAFQFIANYFVTR